MLHKIGLTVLLVALSGVVSASESCKIKRIFFFPVEVCTPTDRDHGPHPAAAPEIDPASAMSGLALALGGLAVLRARKFSSKA